MRFNTGSALAAMGVVAICVLVAAPSEGAELAGGAFAEMHLGADLQVGVRSDPIVSLTHFGDLRVYGLASIDSAGRDGFAAAGLAWRLHLTPTFYVQPALGLAVEGGASVAAEPEVSVGYRLSPRWAVEASYLRLARFAGPSARTASEADLGLRLIYRFAH